jgi:hypothetical protein
MNGNGRSMVRAIRGPVTLITVGVLFALNNFTQFGFDKTWPVLLIVFGLLSLLRRGIEPAVPDPAPTPFNYPPPPPPPGGYARSSYTAPPQQPSGTAAKGGFGTSAPARPGEAGQGTGSTSTPGESL